MKTLAYAWALLAIGARAWACPSCKDAVAQTPESLGLAKGFNHSIFFMLAMVFSLAGLFIWKVVREARKSGAAGPPEHESPL